MGYRTRWIGNLSGGYWDFCDFPLKDADEEQVAAWPMPSPADFNYSEIVEFCNRWKDYAVSGQMKASGSDKEMDVVKIVAFCGVYWHHHLDTFSCY